MDKRAKLGYKMQHGKTTIRPVYSKTIMAIYNKDNIMATDMKTFFYNTMD